jgi:flagellar protein FlgJ
MHYERAGIESLARLGNGHEDDAGSGGGFAEVLEKAQKEVASGPKAAPSKPVVDKTDKLYEQCEALETFLIKNLLNSMRSTVQKTGLVDEGFAGKMYEDMLYDAYAEDFTKQADFGLAALAYLELTGQRS